MKYSRWLLFPFSLIYGLVVVIRNWFYDVGLFKSHGFNIPIISVGNLEVGGAGKSPMVEYLVRLLKNKPYNDPRKLATLSRGYGRKTSGYLEARLILKDNSPVPGVPTVPTAPGGTPGTNTANDSQLTTHNAQLTQQIGDEPAQFKNKFPDITVVVCEKRVEGIKRLLPDHNLIILDDAFQHRAVETGLSILLFDYSRINQPHLLLPAGNFREPFSGRWRAHIIIVTKCPGNISANEQAILAEKIKPLPYQQLYFTTIAYQVLQRLWGITDNFAIDNGTAVFLLTGIANAKPLVNYLSSFTSHLVHHNYPDHHPFTLKNIAKLAAEFSACAAHKKIIVTTEKDAQRLERQWFKQALPGIENLPVFVLPIQVEFLNRSGERFNRQIIEYVREHPAFHRVH